MKRHQSTQAINHIFEQKPRQPLIQRIQKKVIKRLEKAIEITQSNNRSDAEGIHELRVITKRLRAYWQLIRFGVDDETFKQANQRLRTTAKCLASARDQHVLIDSLSMIATQLQDEQCQRLKTIIEERTTVDIKSESDNIDWQSVLSNFQLEYEIWQALPCMQISNQQIQNGLHKTYMYSFKWAEKSIQHKTSVKKHHEWRKWVKHLFYQLKLLKQCGLHIAKTNLKTLEQLGDVLGQEHDFSILANFLLEQKNLDRFDEKLVSDALEVNRKQIQRLRKRIKKLNKPLK